MRPKEITCLFGKQISLHVAVVKLGNRGISNILA
jgi:hypothetical protein